MRKSSDMITVDEFIYFDNNATTPLDPAVIEEMMPFLTKCYGNPSSGYAFAAKARKAVDLARERLQRCSDASRRKLFSPAAAQNPTMR